MKLEERAAHQKKVQAVVRRYGTAQKPPQGQGNWQTGPALPVQEPPKLN